MKTKQINLEEVYEQSIKWWNPNRTKYWQELDIDMVIGKREGYYLYTTEGKQLMDLHLNGGTFNLGHRNEDVVNALTEGVKQYDIGNHHFPSIARANLAEKIANVTPDSLKYTIYASSGSEATDIAIKSARNATKRVKVVSVNYCYHGSTGISMLLGDGRFSKRFLTEGDPKVYLQVPFNDLDAMEQALIGGDVACVILETVPATYGFKMPDTNYLEGVKKLCEQYGTLYIADEVQTGLMRSGEMWGIEHFDVQPDILVTAKGFSGGIYPIAAVVVSEKAGQWLHEDGYAHISTFGGAELGCVVASKVIDICSSEKTKQNVAFVSQYLRSGLDSIQKQYNDYFVGIRQLGVIMGLEFNSPNGAKDVMYHLYKNGVWAIYSFFDPSVLQFKPGLLIDKAYCDDLLNRVEAGIKAAQQHN